jgi:UPF0271 protein
MRKTTAMAIDLNCDMAEGMGNEAAIMPYITSANIACGFHAGNGEIIRQTMDMARKSDVKIGAHPSFRDKEYFGRREMKVPPEKLYALIIEQLIRIDLIAREKNAVLHHVKPHGALYNMAARDKAIAKVVAQAVADFNEDLVLYALSGSVLIDEAKALGLKTASEVFGDRRYMDDGSLVPRSQEGAVIEDEETVLSQVLKMVNEGKVTTITGKEIPIVAETICIHGDTPHAVEFARKIHSVLGSVFS